MLKLEEIHRLGTELEMWLRMRNHPIAFKMLKTKDEVPDDAIIPTRDWKHKYALCQTMAKAQRDGMTIAMFKEDNWCFEPVLGLGLVEPRPEFFEGHHRYPDSVRDLEDAARWCQGMPRLEYGEYQGLVVAPINTCSFIPDLVVMHVNGLQSSQLLIIKCWLDGKDVNSQLSGHAACVYCTVPALLNHECQVAIPCKGDRRLAMAQDDELLFTIPPDMLPGFVEGTCFLQKHNWGLPLKQEYKEEYDLKPGYCEMAELHGMDMSQSPPRTQKFQKC